MHVMSIFYKRFFDRDSFFGNNLNEDASRALFHVSRANIYLLFPGIVVRKINNKYKLSTKYLLYLGLGLVVRVNPDPSSHYILSASWI